MGQLSKIFHIRYLFSQRSSFRGSSNVCVTRPVILGIESSCDDTGAAVVDGQGRILGDGLYSQQAYSSKFGGVVPSVAEQLHEQNIGPAVDEAITSSGLTLQDLDGIAVTTKPGLVPCLRVGAIYALELCKKHRKPLLPIHHMQAHALTVRIPSCAYPGSSVEFPFLCLLVSGGHCILTWIKSADDFLILGEDTDGAPGEAFDKVARRLRLRNLNPDYDNMSGGVLIEKVARDGGGDPLSITLPMPGINNRKSSDCDFAFSGIKTCMLHMIERWEKEQGLTPEGILSNLPNICASFQHAICIHIGRRLERAFVFLRHNKWLSESSESYLVSSGGVASNSYLRAVLAYVAAKYDCRLISPPPKLCTDNGIMIAWNGLERFNAGIGIVPVDQLPDNIWVEHRSPIGPRIGDDEVKHARLALKRWTKLNYNFYDPSYVANAIEYSNARLQRRLASTSA